MPSSVDLNFIKEIHKSFYRNAPEDALTIRCKDGNPYRIVPGTFRSKREDDVQVGDYVPPTSEYVEEFMIYFSKRYSSILKNSSSSKIIAIGPIHHRFNYIHPFLDGNGRVSRLLAHAMFAHAGIGVSGLWSISRGLARGLEAKRRSEEYKIHIKGADCLRDGDYDGRGTLSQRALIDFAVWFLKIAYDQIQFMRGRFEAKIFKARYLAYMGEVYKERNVADAKLIINYLLDNGTIEKARLPALLGVSDPTARKRIVPLIKDGFVVTRSDSQKTPYELSIPMTSIDKIALIFSRACLRSFIQPQCDGVLVHLMLGKGC